MITRVVNKEARAPVDPLDALEGEALTLENATDLDVAEAAGQGQPAAPPPPENAQLIAGAIALGRGIFTKVTKLRSVETTLSDDVARQLGDVWAPVLAKHGIDLNAYLGDYALEIAAAVTTITVMKTVRDAHREEIAAVKAQQANAEKPAEASAAG